MSQTRTVIIGVDVGSTTMSGGLVTEDGDVLTAIETPTHRDGAGTEFETLQTIVRELIAAARARDCRVDGIGVGLAGIVDMDGGTMRKGIHRMRGLAGAPIAERLRAIGGVPVFLDNDVNALALAEWTWGVGRGAASMVMLALGTGVGGAVIIDGHVVRGKNGYGGELGHVSVNFAGRVCLCGTPGCLAAYAAGFGIATEYHRRTHGTGAWPYDGWDVDQQLSNAEAVFRAAEAGDAIAIALIEEACQALGAGIGGIVNALNPDVVVATGGIMTSLGRHESRILGEASRYCFAAALSDTRIAFVPGRKNQTLRGGAALVLYERTHRGHEPSTRIAR